LNSDIPNENKDSIVKKNDDPPFVWRQVFAPLHAIVVLVVFVLDQISKYYVMSNIRMGSRVVALPFLDFIHTKNRGAAFGMFNRSGGAFRFFFFGIVSVLCLYLLVRWLGSIPLSQKLQRVSFALILGGAFGNLYDRIVYGEVTDFIDAYYGDYHFYIFNIADSAITIGVTLLVITMIPWSKLRQSSNKKAESA
jgi:signal peptidase II